MLKNITQDVSFKPISFGQNTSGNDIVVGAYSKWVDVFTRSLIY